MSAPITPDQLDAIMNLDHVVEVHADGTVTDAPAGVRGPECVYLQLDSNGQSLDDDFIDVPDGWRPLTGYTRQSGYRGPVMHSSEFIGGRMARDILANPGLYVAVVVDGIMPEDGDDDGDTVIGWAVFRRDIEH